MNYTVVWLKSAEGNLARLWLDARIRQDITAAADQIDLGLKRDPVNCGESRHGDVRIMFEGPLGVLFRVIDAERKVKVIHVWRH
jgi:hypothetical protein